MNNRLRVLIVAASLRGALRGRVRTGSKAMMMAGVTVKTTSLGPTLVDAKG